MKKSTSTSRRTPLAAGAALGIAALILGLTTSARAEDAAEPAPPVAVSHPADAQHVTALSEQTTRTVDDALSVVADTIYDLGANAGFAGIQLDPDRAALSLHWKGELPSNVVDYLVRASELGVTITTDTNAILTRAEEQAAAERVNTSAPAKNGDIGYVAARPDGQGIVVHMVGKAPDNDAKAEIVAAARLPLDAVTYVADSGKIVPLAGTRNNDVAPWKGGARTVQNGEGCSPAFAALSGSSGRLLSANHCDPAASHQVTDGGGTVIAPAANVVGNSTIDSQSIDPTASPATTPTIFTGAWNSKTTATVKNWASNWTGDNVCAGGAATGSHCGSIVDDSVTYPGYSGSWYVRARATTGAMAGGSDSGGPVYRTVSGGVQARGVILGGYDSTATTCGAHNPDVITAICFRDIVYSPISVVLNTWSYSLEVG